jgi:hypothetical protein
MGKNSEARDFQGGPAPHDSTLAEPTGARLYGKQQKPTD